LAQVLQEQFPALIHLKLEFSYHRDGPPDVTLPDGLLGGSAPRLQSFELNGVPFPALPKLLLSATDLVRLTIEKIPDSGYISPEEIVTGLAVLANLKFLTIRFEHFSSFSSSYLRSPPPPARTVLPALTHFDFRGLREYLEDLVAQIDAPLLDNIWVTFKLFYRPDQPIFDIAQLAQFMRRATRIQTLNEAHVDIDYDRVQLGSLPSTRPFDEKSTLKISIEQSDWRILSMAQLFTFLPIHMVEHLYIRGPRYLRSEWRDPFGDMEWLEFLRPFIAVKNLYVSGEFSQCISIALQELIEKRLADVLPALECLFLEQLGPIQEDIGKFVSARQLSGQPIAVSIWERDWDWEVDD
jgi:hypothetical protein